ncbi:hypothetical protein ACFLZZ_00640 [Nanoarchaeota archaeon]
MKQDSSEKNCGLEAYLGCLTSKECYEGKRKEYTKGKYVVTLSNVECSVKKELYGIVLGVGKEYDFDNPKGKERKKNMFLSCSQINNKEVLVLGIHS